MAQLKTKAKSLTRLMSNSVTINDISKQLNKIMYRKIKPNQRNRSKKIAIEGLRERTEYVPHLWNWENHS